MHKLAHLGTLLLAWLAMSVAGAAPSASGIHRCVGEDNVPIFTDRSCSSISRPEYRPESDESAAIEQAPLRPDCSREIDTLKAQLRKALVTGDFNQLAGLFHWMDTSNETAEWLLAELQVISRQRLVSIEVESWDLDEMEEPVKLWLDQYGPERPGQTIRTGFNLVMHSGCWWLDVRGRVGTIYQDGRDRRDWDNDET